MKNLCVLFLAAAILGSNSHISFADTKQDIKNANKKGNIVFLVVTDKGDIKNPEAMSLAKKVQKSIVKSSVIEFDRGNATNVGLVQEYGLAGAPTPLIIVIAKNGYAAGGGILSNLTAEILINMVPTPKEEDLIKAINEGNSVFVVFSKKTESKNKNQNDACLIACQKMNDKARTINIDMDDKKEKSFISKFNIATNVEFPLTYVVNAQGQVTSMFNGVTEPQNLVAAAKKVVSGCGTGAAGCGTSCGPTK